MHPHLLFYSNNQPNFLFGSASSFEFIIWQLTKLVTAFQPKMVCWKYWKDKFVFFRLSSVCKPIHVSLISWRLSLAFTFGVYFWCHSLASIEPECLVMFVIIGTHLRSRKSTFVLPSKIFIVIVVNVTKSWLMEFFAHELNYKFEDSSHNFCEQLINNLLTSKHNIF